MEGTVQVAAESSEKACEIVSAQFEGAPNFKIVGCYEMSEEEALSLMQSVDKGKLN